VLTNLLLLRQFDPRKFFDKCIAEGETGIKRLRRSLLYRSRQTGWLETDIIMGR
jgi:succinate dehydrogenase flavin-adding protein (antitoxin of CptAB toxin-antitoxin module)